MNLLKISTTATTVLITSLMISMISEASDYYISQNTIGSNTGIDCSNAHPVTWFNTFGNWGNGAGQIKPGDTLHLCGTISTALTVQASGLDGSITTIKFEPGTKMIAPYWSLNDGFSPTSGAITIKNKNFITIDGGTDCGPLNKLTCNGTITSTDNGTTLANKKQNVGVFIENSANIEIKNIAVNNMYLRTGTTNSDQVAAQGSADVWAWGTNTNISIHGCSLSDAHAGAYVSFDGGNLTNLNIYNNYIAHAGWHIAVAAGNANRVATGVNIYGNEITNWNDWADSNATYHTDGIIMYSNGPGGSLNANVYSNYFHGDLGGGTGPNAVSTFICYGGNSIGYIYNNIMKNDGASIYVGHIFIGGWVRPQNGIAIYNNTIVGKSGDSGIYTGGPSGQTDPNITIKNNIIQGCASAIVLGSNSWYPITSDYNVFFNNTRIATNNNAAGPPNYISMSAWQASPYSQDTNSSTATPNLSPTFQIKKESSAIGTGINLSNLGITTLNSDIYNSTRSTSLPWDKGARAFIPSPHMR